MTIKLSSDGAVHHTLPAQKSYGRIVRSDGPIPAKIMIVGEAPGEKEEEQGKPFVGASGYELNRMLHEAGINRTECYIANLCQYRPPKNDIELFWRKPFSKSGKPTKEDERKLKSGIDPQKFVPMRDKIVYPAVAEGFEQLKKEISLVRPNIIIPVGNLSLWALTGNWGITKWRGSMLRTDSAIPGQPAPGYPQTGPGVLPIPWKVIPTYHPAAVLREWSWRAVTVHDLRRAVRFRDGADYPLPARRFIVRPTFDHASLVLGWLLHRLNCGEYLRLSCDIETRAGHIACIGISWSLTEGISIPLMCVERPSGYWTLEQEAFLVSLICLILTHVRVQVVGQNIIYDSQYFWKWLHFVPRVIQDTMISQHSIFSDLPKSLAFQASMYADYYRYWKDEGKDWAKEMGEDQLWYYNIEDCVYTDEVGLVEIQTAKTLGLEEVHEFQQRMFWPVLQAMQRGVRVDTARRAELVSEVQTEIARRQDFLAYVLGFPLNPDSPKQMHTLFYTDFKLPVQFKRGKKGEPSRPTLDDDALQKLVRIEPLIRPLVNAIADIRTLGKFLSNFLCRTLGSDGRFRCSYNIGGSEGGKSAPKTYRLSSSEDAFGDGANMQNIPSEKSKSVGKAKKRGGMGVSDVEGLGDPYKFPNIREIFVPDPGYTWFDLDLMRADLFVFVWEIEDEIYKEVLKREVDAHLFHVYLLDGEDPPPLDELIERHGADETCSCPGRCYWEHRLPRKHKREFSKVFCHAVDYVGGSRTIAANVGLTVHEVDRARRKYLAAHPKIEPYWGKVERQIQKFHFVENKFGYRWYIFDRLEKLLPEAVAWIPQSTVSVAINKIWHRIYTEAPEIQVLMQVHDSLPGQFPTSQMNSCLTKIRECAKVVIPYSDPLTIPVSISTSERSWGHCK